MCPKLCMQYYLKSGAFMKHLHPVVWFPIAFIIVNLHLKLHYTFFFPNFNGQLHLIHSLAVKIINSLEVGTLTMAQEMPVSHLHYATY